jgi:menaquinone-dependent protoporphyrinogen IX oxidase
MKAIVYKTNTGSTKRYAEMLAKETGLPAYELSEAFAKLQKGSEIIYMGWLMAGSIKGYKKALKQFKPLAVCAVGLAFPTEEYKAMLTKMNKIGDSSLFIMQGSFNINKLHGINKIIMNMVASSTIKKIEEKAEKTEEDKKNYEIYKNGCDLVSMDYLKDVIAWYRSRKY